MTSSFSCTLPVEPFRFLKPSADPLQLVLRGGDLLLALLLEDVQHVDRIGETHSVDRTVGVAVVVFDDLQDAGSAEALQRLRARMLGAELRPEEREAYRVAYRFGKSGSSAAFSVVSLPG
jgi:hypothetical protein